MTRLTRYLNNIIEREAKTLRYIVKDSAPSTESELLNESSLVIWSGASENTIFSDSSINYKFRAIHDAFHLSSGIVDFSPKAEMFIGKLQANQFCLKYGEKIADLIFCEVFGQAEYFLNHGVFVKNQKLFTETKLGIKL